MEVISDWLKKAEEEITPFCSATELNGLRSRLNSLCDKEFSRGVSELVISSYYAKKNQKGLLIPRGAKKDKDIDVSFSLSKRQVNIEVKCPDLSYDNSQKFTLHIPHTHQNLRKRKLIESEMVKMLNNNANIIPNKVLNFKHFLKGCTEKFEQQAGIDDLNIIVFSMLDIEWMDDYRIKIEEEKILQKYNNIDAVVLSNAAQTHSKTKPNRLNKYGFENCFNYLIFNNGSKNHITSDEKKEIMSLIPNQTVESRIWYRQLVEGDEPIGIQVKSIQRLALYWKIAMASEEIINGDLHRKT